MRQKCGSWSATIRFCRRWITTADAATTTPASGAGGATTPLAPHQRLQLQFCTAIAYTKLRRYNDAIMAIDSIGDLDAPSLQYQAYPSVYAGLKGSRITRDQPRSSEPALASGNHSATIDLMFSLLARCKTEIMYCEANPPTSANATKSTGPVQVDLSELAVSLPSSSVCHVTRSPAPAPCRGTYLLTARLLDCSHCRIQRGLPNLISRLPSDSSIILCQITVCRSRLRLQLQLSLSLGAQAY